ncbi:MAG: DUF4189 domain-containing protein [Magnetococcales bacterium]|nr:DUF4189 domain-containing protein [Magnetococcales bacterium]
MNNMIHEIIKIITLSASLFAAPGAWAIGAIAIDNQLGDDEPAFGVSVGEDDKESAKKAALKYCRQAGGENCQFIVWFETCGAVAVSKKYYGYGYGSTKAKATGDALEMCNNNNCNIVAAECE